MIVRSQAIKDAARGEDCQLRVPGICNNNTETVVACHSNWQEDGKGTGHKAEDIFVAFGCLRCHIWLDEGRASDDEKRDIFHRGMKRTWKRLIEKGVIAIKGMK